MFRLLGLLFTVLNLLVAFRIYRWVAERLPARQRWLGVVAGLGLMLLVHQTLLMALGGVGALRWARAAFPNTLLLVGSGAQFAVWVYLVLSGARTLFRMLRKVVPRTAKGSAASHATQATQAEPNIAPNAPELIAHDRRSFVAGAGLVLPAIAIAASTKGVAEARSLPVVTRVPLPVRRGQTALHGVKIAQLSDVHVGSYMDAARVDAIARAVNATGADIHVITGDLLDNHVSQLELATRLIRGLRPKSGQVLLSMGNHEYYAARTADVPTIIKELEHAGAQILIDEARAVRFGADRLWMLGIDYPLGRRVVTASGRTTEESLRQALSTVAEDGAPRIVLSHHPSTFSVARHTPIDLMLSGHTHGGQINFGRVGDYALTPALPLYFYHNGLYEHEGRRLYVNAGAGGWLPVRINCPPEITLVELVPA